MDFFWCLWLFDARSPANPYLSATVCLRIGRIVSQTGSSTGFSYPFFFLNAYTVLAFCFSAQNGALQLFCE